MKYRQLGRTGVQVSALCLGCWMFGRRTDEAESIGMINEAIESGINFIDTANVYSAGKSEEIVGKALAINGRRERIILATKVHGTMDESDPNASGNHRRHIIQACEDSLRRLRTDHIDLYQLHRPDAGIPLDETIRALDDLITAGKVLYIGTSTFAAWQIVEGLWISKELGLNRFISEQPPYNLLDRRAERELIPMARTFGLAILPWSPLAGGVLTGKYRRGAPAPIGARYDQSGITADLDKAEDRALLADSTFDVVDALVGLAESRDCSPGQLALAWLLNQPGVTSPIIGPRTQEQLNDNLAAVGIEVTDADRARLDDAATPGRATSPFYDADFGPHPFRW